MHVKKQKNLSNDLHTLATNGDVAFKKAVSLIIFNFVKPDFIAFSVLFEFNF